MTMRVIEGNNTQTFRNYFSELEPLGFADVVHNPLKGDAFIDVTIEGHRFKGVVTHEGPLIVCESLFGSCNLGVCSIHYCSNPHHDNSYKRWHVCKYGPSEPLMNLSLLSDKGIRTVAREFGLVIHDGSLWFLSCISESYAFYASTAFCALQTWAKSHPRKIKTYKPNSYLFGWPSAAINGHCPINEQAVD